MKRMSKMHTATIIVFWGLIVILQLLHPKQSFSGTADKVVDIINSEYGRVCTAEVSGLFSKTLQIDWTANTTKLHVVKIFAEIGNVKEILYNDGVRYFKFPNNAGTYNIVDWKTGDKTSTNERAPYYFND